VPHVAGQPVSAQVLFPRDAGAGATWDPALGTLAVTLSRCPSACLLRLSLAGLYAGSGVPWK
jgi:hypothetical protein